MNPDVFITIVFVGIAVAAALVALAFILPQTGRDDARRDPRPPSNTRRTEISESSGEPGATTRGRDAAVH